MPTTAPRSHHKKVIDTTATVSADPNALTDDDLKPTDLGPGENPNVTGRISAPKGQHGGPRPGSGRPPKPKTEAEQEIQRLSDAEKKSALMQARRERARVFIRS